MRVGPFVGFFDPASLVPDPVDVALKRTGAEIQAFGAPEISRLRA